MSVSILECLYNAQYNLVDGKITLQKTLGAEQLKNSIALLEKGYSINDEVEPLIDKFGSVEKVPDKTVEAI